MVRNPRSRSDRNPCAPPAVISSCIAFRGAHTPSPNCAGHRLLANMGLQTFGQCLGGMLWWSTAACTLSNCRQCAVHCTAFDRAFEKRRRVAPSPKLCHTSDSQVGGCGSGWQLLTQTTPWPACGLQDLHLGCQRGLDGHSRVAVVDSGGQQLPMAAVCKGGLPPEATTHILPLSGSHPCSPCRLIQGRSSKQP